MFTRSKKNITGTIYFDQDAHQLYGETEDKNDIFPDPLLQVDLQKAQLRRFLLEYSIDIPPIFTASVFVHPNARLLLQDYSERSRILTRIALPSYLEKLAKKISSSNNQSSGGTSIRIFRIPSPVSGNQHTRKI